MKTPNKPKKASKKSGSRGSSSKPKVIPKVNKPTGRPESRRTGIGVGKAASGGRKPGAAGKAAKSGGKPATAAKGAGTPPRQKLPGRGAGGPDLDRDSGARGQVNDLGPLLPVEPRPEDPRTKKMALTAWDAALEKKCVEPVLLDVRALASYTDYILIVSGRSDRQVQSIGEGVREALSRESVRPMGSEGLKDGQWSLLDFGDVIVHVFYHPVREFYDLEGLWADAPRVPLEVPPEARAHYADSYAP